MALHHCKCPGCGHPFEFDRSRLGSGVTCPQCAQRFMLFDQRKPVSVLPDDTAFIASQALKRRHRNKLIKQISTVALFLGAILCVGAQVMAVKLVFIPGGLLIIGGVTGFLCAGKSK